MKNKEYKVINIAIMLIVLLLFLVTLFGIGSFSLDKSYPFINQYGDTIQIYGAGLYAYDSLFKAPISIGTDFTVLVIVIPLLIFVQYKLRKNKTIDTYVSLFSLLCIILYYSASIILGVTYNNFFLVYLLLFILSFYMSCTLFLKLYKKEIITQEICSYTIPKGLITFLYISATALFVAWLPDIITSLLQHSSLALIEVYTTEITYIIDMGIISPWILLTVYFIKKHSFIGYVWVRGILKICSIIGIMLPIQSIFQLAHGIEIPLPVLISKMLIFVILALFAMYFEKKLKSNVIYNQEVF